MRNTAVFSRTVVAHPARTPSSAQSAQPPSVLAQEEQRRTCGCPHLHPLFVRVEGQACGAVPEAMTAHAQAPCSAYRAPL